MHPAVSGRARASRSRPRPAAQAIMSLYNTVPDLEASEAQPLVAAPRKLGKTLAVVALFGFAAGAATATAAPHVAAKMNFAIMSTAGGVETGPCTGSDCIFQHALVPTERTY